MYRLVDVVWCVDVENEVVGSFNDVPVHYPVLVDEDELRDWIEYDNVCDRLSDSAEWIVSDFEITSYITDNCKEDVNKAHSLILDKGIGVCVEQVNNKGKKSGDRIGWEASHRCHGYAIDECFTENLNDEDDESEMYVNVPYHRADHWKRSNKRY